MILSFRPQSGSCFDSEESAVFRQVLRFRRELLPAPVCKNTGTILFGARSRKLQLMFVNIFRTDMIILTIRFSL